MNYPTRLIEIAKLIEDGSNVADIGADHGILEAIIAGTQPNTKVLAVENKIGPFNILCDNVKALKNITPFLSNGLDNLPPKIDTLVIAGMGGANIISILERHPRKIRKIKKVILLPHRNIPQVRKRMRAFGFEIVREKLVYDHKIYYNIILFDKIKGKQKLTKDEINFGYNLSDDPLFKSYKNQLIYQRKRILKNVTDPKRIDKVNKEIERIRKYGENEVI